MNREFQVKENPNGFSVKQDNGKYSLKRLPSKRKILKQIFPELKPVAFFSTEPAVS